MDVGILAGTVAGTVDIAVAETAVAVGLTADPLSADDVAVAGTMVAVGLAVGAAETVEVSVAVATRVGIALTFSSPACDPAQEAPKSAKKTVISNAIVRRGNFCSME